MDNTDLKQKANTDETHWERLRNLKFNFTSVGVNDLFYGLEIPKKGVYNKHTPDKVDMLITEHASSPKRVYAELSKHGDHCQITITDKIEAQTLTDILTITHELFKNSPIKTYSF